MTGSEVTESGAPANPPPRLFGLPAVVGLLVVLVLALAVRLPAIDRGLPCIPESDAVLVQQASHFDAQWRGEKTREPALNRQYPPLLGALAAALPGRVVPTLAPGALEEQLAAASRPYLLVRWLVLLLGLGALPLVYLLGRRALGQYGALAAAFLVAVSTLHALFTTQARPHGALTTFVLLALLALAHRARRGGAWTALMAGCACALPVACLHNGLAVLVPLAAVELLRARRERRILLPSTLLVLLPVLASFWISYPDLMGRERTVDLTTPEAGPKVNLSGHLLKVEDFDGSGFGLVAKFLAITEPVLLVLGVCGLLLGLYRLRGGLWRALIAPGREEWFVAAAFGVVYALAIGSYARTFTRFALPLIPLLALAAAYAMQAAMTGRWQRASWRVGLACLCVLCCAPVVRSAWRWAQPTTVEALAGWARETLPDRTRIALPLGVDAPLAMDVQRVRWLPQHLHSPWALHLLRDANLVNSIAGPVAFPSGRMPGHDALIAKYPDVAERLLEIKDSTSADYIVALPISAELPPGQHDRADRDQGKENDAAGPHGGRRHARRGPQPPPSEELIRKFDSGCSDPTLDTNGDSLDDWSLTRFWTSQRLGPELQVYRGWRQSGDELSSPAGGGRQGEDDLPFEAAHGPKR
ncbi:MAG: phospholipid carrier-dependent glycosyltransferase [Planctomycetes bacterium]|nr:phospholipid carrier-dependent glycosyltransferase [Planctomycetota bacterium]